MEEFKDKTFRLMPVKLWQQVKSIAVLEGISLRDLLIEILTDYVEKYHGKGGR